MIRAIVISLVVAAPAVASTVGYVQATDYLKKDSRPTLYQPLNLVDGRPNTAWCLPGTDTLNDTVSIGFKGPEKIDEIRISNGNNFSEDVFKSFGRAKRLEIKGQKGSKTFEIEDKRELQTVTFDPPLEGSRFVLEVLDQFPSDDLDASACITDLVFISKGAPIAVSGQAHHLKYDKNTATVMGTWYAGYAGKPDKFLAFNLDGTFRYSYEPYDTKLNKPSELSGTYNFVGGQLTLQLGKNKHNAKLRFDSAKDKKGGRALTMEGDVPAELKQQFRAAP